MLKHYNIVPQNLHPASPKQPVYLWYLKSQKKNDNPITSIAVHDKDEDEVLSSEGYKCIGRGISRSESESDMEDDPSSSEEMESSLPSRRHNNNNNNKSAKNNTTSTYLWCKRRSRAETVDEGIGIVDIAVTMGDQDDPDSFIHVAPSVDYQLVRGNVRSRLRDPDMFLWIRQQMKPNVRSALLSLQKWCRDVARVDNHPGEMNYRRAWEILDADHSGVVPLDEFEKFLETQNIGKDLDMTEKAAMLAHLDRNQNDELNYEEFVKFVRERLPEESGAIKISRRRRRNRNRSSSVSTSTSGPTRSTPQLTQATDEYVTLSFFLFLVIHTHTHTQTSKRDSRLCSRRSNKSI